MVKAIILIIVCAIIVSGLIATMLNDSAQKSRGGEVA